MHAPHDSPLEPTRNGRAAEGRPQTPARRPAAEPSNLLNLVLDGAPVVLWEVDLDGVLSSCRGGGLNVLGLGPDDAVGRRLGAVFPSVPQIDEDLQLAIQGRTFRDQLQINGLSVETSFAPARDGGGHIVGVLAVSTVVVPDVREATVLERLNRDLETRIRQRTELLRSTNRVLQEQIRDRRNVLDQLREAEDRWLSIVANVTDSVVTLTRDGTILFANRPWPGAVPQDMVGSTVFEFLPTEHHKRVHALLQKVYRTGTPATDELRLGDEPGCQRWYSNRIGPIKRDDRVVALVIVSTDITPQKQAEGEAHRRQDELAHVSRLSVMGEVAAMLAHELNSPLSAISNFAGGCIRRLRSRSYDRDELTDALEQIVRLSARAGETIHRIRGFLQKRERQLETIDVNVLVREAVEITRPHAERCRTAVRFELSAELPLLRADRIQFEQVLVNLLLNAVESMRGCRRTRREVVVRTARDGGDRLLVSVADCGRGLPDDFEACIFEPFYTTKPNGLGIGLSISRSIVEAHGGKLWARRNDGGPGATFHVCLPAGRGADR